MNIKGFEFDTPQDTYLREARATILQILEDLEGRQMLSLEHIRNLGRLIANREADGSMLQFVGQLMASAGQQNIAT